MEIPLDINYVEWKDFPRRGFISIDVLPELNGRQFDDYAIGLIHALRPSCIRVSSNGCIKTDSMVWRVTVYTTPNKIIEKVEQEVVVGLPEGCENGYEFGCHMKGVTPAKPTVLPDGRKCYLFFNFPNRKTEGEQQ